MLIFLNAVQLVLYIALLALVGQGVLYVLAGAQRENNFFYKFVQVLSKPFMLAVRRVTPRRVPASAVAAITFCLLAALYMLVTFERVDFCVTNLRVGQAGCR